MTLAEYLKESTLSQAEFGRRIGVSQPAVGRYVRGVRIPKRAIMAKIAEATGGAVTAQDFYEAA